MLVQAAGIEAGVLLGGIGVHLAADGVHVPGQLGGGPPLGALEEHVLDKVGRAVLPGSLVAGAHPHKKAQRGGAGPGDLLREQPRTVGQSDLLIHDKKPPMGPSQARPGQHSTNISPRPERASLPAVKKFSTGYILAQKGTCFHHGGGFPVKKRSRLEQLGDFVLGKGFYIVLLLCVATIGVSGYALVHNFTAKPAASSPAGGSASVVLPDLPEVPEEPAPVVNPETPARQADPAPAPAAGTDDPQPAARGQEPVVYTRPVKGEVLRPFSVETLTLDPTLGDWRTHGGVDLAAAIGTEVLAMGPGTVAEVKQDGLMGTTVVVDQGDGLRTTYANLAAKPTVSEGDTVRTGDILGAVGDTAIAESGLAPHLHLETRMDGQPVDPMSYLDQA